jgi:hypothetical protein
MGRLYDMFDTPKTDRYASGLRRGFGVVPSLGLSVPF